MAHISTTIGITPEDYKKSIELGINRSKFCREALSAEIARIEKKNKHGAALGRNSPRSTSHGEAV